MSADFDAFRRQVDQSLLKSRSSAGSSLSSQKDARRSVSTTTSATGGLRGEGRSRAEEKSEAAGGHKEREGPTSPTSDTSKSDGGDFKDKALELMK